MLKKLLATLAISFTCALPAVAAGGYPSDTAPNRLNDLASLQNGAKLFVNYCLNCHSANSMRYNKLTDIGLTEEEITRNLLFTSDKVGDLMTIAMTREDSSKWFGAAPPDLSVIARSKSVTMGASGVDYVYNFLRGFYRDASRPTGWDNTVFPSVGMPHALWQLQGEGSLEHTSVRQGDDGKWTRKVTTYDAQGFSEVKTETLDNYSGGRSDTYKRTAADAKQDSAYDSDVADLANFLGWMSEPDQLFRKQLGIGVLFFLAIFLFVALRLNAAYWRHVK